MTTRSERLLTFASFANLSSFPSASTSKESKRRLRSAATGVCALLLLLGASMLGYAQDASSAAVRATAAVKQIGAKRLRSAPPYARTGAPLKRRPRTPQTHKPLISGTISYTCDPSVSAPTCNYLNTVIAGDYSSTFTNANASIYITYGTTGLGESNVGFLNLVTYAQYVAALASNTNQSAIQVAALSALNTYDAGPYGSDNIEVTAPLATALGLAGDVQGGILGLEVGGSPCTPGSAGCYDGIITVTNDPSTPLYYDNLGGAEPADAYDFYGVVEHETDEILGTASCITTATVPLSDGCGSGVASAVDLYRYSAPGDLILDSSLSTTPGAYFSYNGGTTNGANGVANTPKIYNTLDNGEDYADFLSSTPDCGTNQAIQDAEGCPGEDAGITILNDGGGEINILNAVGFDVPGQLCSPGTYSNTGDTPCTPAPAGTYVATTGAIEPTNCATGTYQPNTGQTSCLAAPAGTYVATTGAIEPTDCAVGSYQPSTGQTSCLAAPAGSAVSFSGATQPTLCSPGSYQPSTGQTSCLAAPAGSYVSTPGAIAATLCAPGNYQPSTGTTSCIVAQPGSYVSTSGATFSTLCAPGSYQPSAGQTSCILAQPGSYVSTSGASSSTPCAAGSYSPSTGAASCIAAPAGSYVAGSGAAVATPCTAGSYQPSTGQTSCILAAIGYFVANPGQTGETQCPAGETTLAPGATSCIPVSLTASPGSLNFGNVELCRAKKEVVTLTNNGATKVQIGAISFTNVIGNPADFQFHEYCVEKLSPGHSCTIAVGFTPDAEVTDTATLNIVTSAPGSPLQVPITATGIKGPRTCPLNP